MKRSKLLQLNNSELNSIVKIEGTKYDRRRKLSDSQIKELKKLFNKGELVCNLAKIYNITERTVLYHCVKGQKEFVNSYRAMYKQYSKSNVNERAEYKRLLIKNKLI